MDPLILIPITVSIGPVIIVSIFINDRKSRLWFYYILGMAGWYVALILRLPILLFIQAFDRLLVLLIAALLAGIFEETTRFIILRYILRSNPDPKIPLSIGLGWGLSEALIIYVANVVLAHMLYGFKWYELMAGAIERNSACLFHASMAMLIGYPFIRRRNPLYFVGLAIFLHASFDLLPFFIKTYVSSNIWFIEGILLFASSITAIAIILVYKNLFSTKYISGLSLST